MSDNPVTADTPTPAAPAAPASVTLSQAQFDALMAAINKPVASQVSPLPSAPKYPVKREQFCNCNAASIAHVHADRIYTMHECEVMN